MNLKHIENETINAKKIQGLPWDAKGGTAMIGKNRGG